MKKILFLLLLLTATLLHGQQITVTTTTAFKQKDDYRGRYYKFGNKYLRYSIDYGAMQFAYTAKLDKVHYTINLYSYDESMNEIKKISLDDDKKIMGPFPPEIFVYNGKLEVLYYRYPDDGDIIQLYMAQVDPDNLTIEAIKELFTLNQKNLGLFKIEDALNSNKIFVTFSPDRSKILIANSNDQLILSCIVDGQLNITQNTVIKNKNMEGFYVASTFIDNYGNKYYSYTYSLDKEKKRGIVTESYKGGQPKFQEFKTGQTDYWANDLFFYSSRDNSKIYLYANYYAEYLNEGLLLTTIDTVNFKIAKPQLFAYPDEFKQRLSKEDFAEKNKGHISVRRIDFSFNELDDGIITFTGSPSYSETNVITGSNGLPKGSVTRRYAVAIIGIFIQPKDNKAVFSMIPRRLEGSAASLLISRIYNNQLLCLYCDKEKNISASLSEKSDFTNDSEDMVLVAAIFDGNGDILSRKKVADKPGDDNFYLLSEARQFKEDSYLIPIGRDRVNLAKYYRQIEKLALVEIK